MDEKNRIRMAREALADHLGADDDTSTRESLMALAVEIKESAEELETEAALLQSASEIASGYSASLAEEMWEDASSTLAVAHEMRDAYMRAMFALKGVR